MRFPSAIFIWHDSYLLNFFPNSKKKRWKSKAFKSLVFLTVKLSSTTLKFFFWILIDPVLIGTCTNLYKSFSLNNQKLNLSKLGTHSTQCVTAMDLIFKNRNNVFFRAHFSFGIKPGCQFSDTHSLKCIQLCITIICTQRVQCTCIEIGLFWDACYKK